MCTVSFVARPRGYAVAMNRDEQRSRYPGLPPQLRRDPRRWVLCPSEPGGGSWIALNEAGVALALINWYSVPQNQPAAAVSRGEVVNAVSDKDTAPLIEKRLEQLPLAQIKPFRLIGFFPGKQEIVQWQWDLKQLNRVQHDWQTQQWISSGFNEPEAQRVRSRTFAKALHHKNAGSLEWLRALHRSHVPKTGPFSTCMHREDAVTVSCTEIDVAAGEGTMIYRPGPPCECHADTVFQYRMTLKTAPRSSRDETV
jgi:hypothetical protein